MKKTHFTPDRIVFFLIIFFTILSGRQSIADNGIEISDILVVGNKHTDEDVITRELLFKTGDLVSDSLLELSRKRILNLWLFNRVEFQKIPDHGKTALLIIVTERWYLFPYPVFRIEDRDWDKISYGFGLAHNNFRGRNEKMYFSLIFGNRPGYYFNFIEPWMGEELHLTMNYLLNKYSKENRFYEFDEKHFDNSLSIGKYWTKRFYSRIHFSRIDLTVPEEYKMLMPTRSAHEVNYGIQLSTAYDSRDIYAYPRNGWLTQFVIGKYGLFEPLIDYWKFAVDLRKYVSWNAFTLAMRFYNIQSIGSLPVYDYNFIGYAQRIRGHFYTVFPGKHAAIGAAEFRYLLIPKRYFSIKNSLLPDYLTRDLFFGMGLGIFADTGLAWDAKDQLDPDNFKSGFGFGIHFLIPYVELLRFDVAFNEDFKTQYIFEVGAAL